jgi:hypothetical protein
MKNALLVVVIVCAGSACFGQVAASISNQPQPIMMPSHPMTAQQHSLAMEQSLVGGGPSTYAYAQGERPLWEFGPSLPPPVPLGDVARAVRKEKATAKKSEFVFEKQGS